MDKTAPSPQTAPTTTLQTVDDFARALRVNRGSIYQSMPGLERPKLGRNVPPPIRLGRTLRWTPGQIEAFIEELMGAEYQPAPSPTGKKRGRPRKTPILGIGAAGGAGGAGGAA